MKRDLPLPLQEQAEDKDRPSSMLASRAFWVGGALSAVVWAVLFWVVKVT